MTGKVIKAFGRGSFMLICVLFFFLVVIPGISNDTVGQYCTVESVDGGKDADDIYFNTDNKDIQLCITRGSAIYSLDYFQSRICGKKAYFTYRKPRHSGEACPVYRIECDGDVIYSGQNGK